MTSPWGGGKFNSLMTDTGNDVLLGGGKFNSMLAGEGDDVLLGAGKFNQMAGQAGDDVMVAGGKFNVMKGGLGNDELIGGGKFNSLLGGDGADELRGAGKNNVFFAGAGDDVLQGAGNNNVFSGGAGDDTLYAHGKTNLFIGEAGNDTYIVNDPLLGLVDKAYIDNRGDLDSIDRLLLNGDLEGKDIKFQKLDKHLQLDLLQGDRQIVLKGWYSNTAAQIDEFQLSNGTSLQQSQVQTLVKAWSDYDSGTITAEALDSTIDSTWTV